MFTRKKLEELHKISDSYIAIKEQASELLRTAQDRFKHVEVVLEREGKEVTLTEKVLWDEVFLMGPGSSAGQALKKRHPEVFEAFKKQDEIGDELKKYCKVEFDVDFTQMTISDYLRMTEGMFELMLVERGLVDGFKSPINIDEKKGGDEEGGGSAKVPVTEEGPKAGGGAEVEIKKEETKTEAVSS